MLSFEIRAAESLGAPAKPSVTHAMATASWGAETRMMWAFCSANSPRETGDQVPDVVRTCIEAGRNCGPSEKCLVTVVDGASFNLKMAARRVSGSDRILTKKLRELEGWGLISRREYPVIPPKAEYSPTALGNTLRPVMAAMAEWGLDHRTTIAETQ
jgi:hypothetical protein